MERIRKVFKSLLFAMSFIFITTSYNNCGQMFGLSEEVKFDYLSSNTVFDSETLDSETAVTWLDGEGFEDGMEQLNQMDDGQGDVANNNNDQGSNGDLSSDNGDQDGNNQNNDGGQNDGQNNGRGIASIDGGNTSNDHGIDKFDMQDPGNAGITVPTPTVPGALKNSIAPGFEMARMRNCTQENGEPGFQFMRADNMTFSACDICEVVDRINGRCLIRVRLPDPPPRAVVIGNGGDGRNGGGDGGDGDPLIIDVMPGHKSDETTQLGKLNLSAPQDGVGFDIYGQRGPTPHQKMQISWTDNPRYMYLALPNSHGQILGVNELFGDSTFGPDRRYALDGFHALTKYDGMDARGIRRLSHPDGKIDKKDAIFPRLRLWADTNFSGTAEPSEIKTLEEIGLESIDLKYDPNFYERDVYGNEAIFKSVAQFSNGELGIVFDLWFDVDPQRPLRNPGPRSGTSMRGPASLDRSF